MSLAHQTFASLDWFFYSHPVLSDWSINGYPVLVIFWNILLLALPWLAAYWLEALRQRGKLKTRGGQLLGWLAGLMWLMFIPNAAYIMTDVRHLSGFCPPAAPYRACLSGIWLVPVFFAYGLLGWLAFVYLVRQMRDFLLRLWGRRTARWLIVCLMPLISLAVLIGLFDRWNSWEVFLAPFKFLRLVGAHLVQPAYLANWLIFSVFLAMFYVLGDKLFKPIDLLNKFHGLSKNRPGQRPDRKRL
jgi:uncharacterized membrane protein